MKYSIRGAGRVFLLLLISVAPSLAVDHRVLLMSDLHFNPFLSKSGAPFSGKANDPCDRDLAAQLVSQPVESWDKILDAKPQTFSPYFEDTNYALLRSSLDEMRRRASDAALVVITGDFLVHEFQSKFNDCIAAGANQPFAAFVSKTMQFLAAEVGSRFPRAQVLPVLGNNDSAIGDYKIEPDGMFLADFKKYWEKMISPSPGVSADLGTLPHAGYYSAAIRHAPGLRAIALDTTLWSSRNEPSSTGCQDDLGEAQIAWLKSAMENARKSNQRVWIIGHIPPGVDAYATVAAVLTRKPAMFYKKRCNSSLLAALRDAGSVVQLGLFGHTHNNEFRIVGAGAQATGLQLVPSISPIHGNNSAFMVLNVSADFSPQDYVVYFLNLAAKTSSWSQEYTFSKAYHQRHFSGQALFQASQEMADDAKLREAFARYFFSGSDHGGLAKLNWRGFWCGFTNLEQEQYSSCMTATPSQARLRSGYTHE